MNDEQTYEVPPLDQVWDAENSYFLNADNSRLAKVLSQYEIYKEILGVPGQVIECGVYKGASLMRLTQFRRFLENDEARSIIAFDAFGKFPHSENRLSSDTSFIENFEATGGLGISKADLQTCITRRTISNVMLNEGNVFDTVPEFLERTPNTKIALLHLDLDVYDATKFCLENFFPLMSQGGVIMIDDYSSVEGATKAVDEFLSNHTGLSIGKAAYYAVPATIKIS